MLSMDTFSLKAKSRPSSILSNSFFSQSDKSAQNLPFSVWMKRTEWRRSFHLFYPTVVATTTNFWRRALNWSIFRWGNFVALFNIVNSLNQEIVFFIWKIELDKLKLNISLFLIDNCSPRFTCLRICTRVWMLLLPSLQTLEPFIDRIEECLGKNA